MAEVTRIQDEELAREALAHAGAIRAIGRRMLPAHADLDDFAQEVYLRAFANLGKLKDPEALPKWIMTISRHTAGTWNRRRRPMITDSLPDLPSPVPLVDERLVGQERWSALIEALSRMRHTDSDLLRRYYLDEATYSELEAETGLSYSALRVRISRARQTLQQQVSWLLGTLGLISTTRMPRGLGEAPRGSARLEATISLMTSTLLVSLLGIAAYRVAGVAAEVDLYATHGETLIPIEQPGALQPKRTPVEDGAADHDEQPVFVARSLGVWKRRADMPAPRAQQAAGSVGDSVYVFGGSNNVPGERSKRLSQPHDPSCR